MITYEYECEQCGHEFEVQQSIKDEPIKECPKCDGKVHRLISGGSGFILKAKDGSCSSGACSYEETGSTCCGLNSPCGSGT